MLAKTQEKTEREEIYIAQRKYNANYDKENINNISLRIMHITIAIGERYRVKCLQYFY